MEDETLEMIQDQFKKFSEEQVIPHAHEWHLKDKLIPFYLLFKALGWTRDKDIVDNIIYGYEGHISSYMQRKLDLNLRKNLVLITYIWLHN